LNKGKKEKEMTENKDEVFLTSKMRNKNSEQLQQKANF
jgi:hypothetical protein